MIEITHVLNDATQELSRQVWRFWLKTDGTGDNPVLVLDSYYQESRLSKRHKWVTTKEYRRINFRYARQLEREHLTKDQVDLPSFVVEQAKQKFMSILKVEKERN